MHAPVIQHKTIVNHSLAHLTIAYFDRPCSVISSFAYLYIGQYHATMTDEVPAPSVTGTFLTGHRVHGLVQPPARTTTAPAGGHGDGHQPSDWTHI